MKEYKLFWKNSLNFKGRSTRKEYWTPQIINAVILFIISLFCGSTLFQIIDQVIIKNKEIYINEDKYNLIMTVLMITFVFMLITLIPNIAISVRRFKDTGVSGIWYFVLLIFPVLIGILIRSLGVSVINSIVVIINVMTIIIQFYVVLMPTDSLKKNIFWS